MAEETRVEGNVSGHIYLKYFRAGSSILLLVVILVLSVIAEVSRRWKASNILVDVVVLRFYAATNRLPARPRWPPVQRARRF